MFTKFRPKCGAREIVQQLGFLPGMWPFRVQAQIVSPSLPELSLERSKVGTCLENHGYGPEIKQNKKVK